MNFCVHVLRQLLYIANYLELKLMSPRYTVKLGAWVCVRLLSGCVLDD